MRILYLVDYCGFVFGQTDFEAVWAKLKKFYPETLWRELTPSLGCPAARRCTVEKLEALENAKLAHFACPL